ncbi:MAG: PEPxxWA-CTERM sorting domain-containing protein [Sphingomonadaceae bacterium]
MHPQKPNRKAGLATLNATNLLATALLGATPASAAITINSDPILYWNDIAITLATAFTPGGAPAQARAYAMVNIAMHDAVNATRGSPNRSYLTGVSNAGGDSRAAAAQAAHDVLVALNPVNAAQYATALTNSLALVGNGTAKTNGIATGAAYAAAIIANRTGDGSGVFASYTSTNLPGDWRPTPPGNAAAALPAWGNVKTFVLSSVNDVPVIAPPALNSAAYAAAYNEVKDIVIELQGANLTPEQQDQRNSAFFWDVSNGGTWIRAGLAIAEDEGLDTLGFAEVFALLAAGISDASVVIFDSKYDYRLWRPITAIHLGDTDGNAATIADPNWSSLFPAPPHPSYLSGHSGISGAASTILQSFFGDDEAFQFSIGPDTRSFTSLSQAELDAANSRLWGGIHFRFDNEEGLRVGRQVGALALQNGLVQPVPEPSTWIMMIAGFGLMGSAMRARRPRIGKVSFG